MDIGKEIRKLRKENKLTQDDLEEITGISAKTISFVEKGRRDTKTQTADILLNAFGYQLAIVPIDNSDTIDCTWR